MEFPKFKASCCEILGEGFHIVEVDTRELSDFVADEEWIELAKAACEVGKVLEPHYPLLVTDTIHEPERSKTPYARFAWSSLSWTYAAWRSTELLGLLE